MMNLGELKFGALYELLDYIIDYQYVIRFYYDEPGQHIDGVAHYERVVGYTLLGETDAILHLIDGSGEYLEAAIEADEYGLRFETFSKIVGRHGFAIYPNDQVDYEEDYDYGLADEWDEDDEDWDEDEDDEWDASDYITDEEFEYWLAEQQEREQTYFHKVR